MLPTRNYVRPLKRLFFLLLFIFPFALSAQIPDDAYCIPEVSSDEDLYINHFSFNNIDNHTGNNGFTNYPMPIANIIPGHLYNYHIGFPNAGNKYYAIYIDLNGDGDFNEVNEKVAGGSTVDIEVSSSLTIPVNTTLDGQAKMHVLVSYDPILHPCDPIRGEGEGYTVEAEEAHDPDWDIVVTSGLFIPNHGTTSEFCGSVSFEIQSNDCYGNLFGPSTVPYGIKIVDQNGMAVMTGSTSTSFINNGNPHTVEVPLYNNTNTPFSYGKPYEVYIIHGFSMADIDCLSPQALDEHQFEINSFPRCDDPRGNGGDGLVQINESRQQISTKMGLKEYEQTAVKVSPNPFKDEVEINFNLESYTDQLQIKVIDLFGRQLEQSTILYNLYPGRNKQLIDLHTLPAGAYYLLIENENIQHVEKLLKLQ